MKISELPIEDRPREKALKLGIGSLSDAELLALLIGKGSRGVSALELSYKMLNDFGTLSSLCNASFPELSSYPGIKWVKSIELMATFEISKRLHLEEGKYSRYNPEELHKYFKRKDHSFEAAYVFGLDGRGNIKAEKMVMQGGASKLQLGIKDILMTVMRLGYSRFVLVHNHTSNVPLPSKSDIEFTTSLQNEAASLSLRLFDHLVVGKDSYFSFLENGLI